MIQPDSPINRSIIPDHILRLVGARGSLRQHLLKSVGGTFILKITATGLGFLTTLILARVLGAAEYGIYSYAMAWVGLLGIPASMGFHQLLVRDVASYCAQEEWGFLRGLLRFSNRLVLAVSIALMAGAAWAGWMLLDSGENVQVLLTFWVALLALPFSALTQLRQAAMRGFQQIIWGQLPEMFIRPLSFLVMFVGAIFFFRQHLTAELAAVLNVIATVIAFAIGLYFLNKVLPIKTKKAYPQFRARAWLGSALPLVVVAGIQLINFRADVILLGVYQDSTQVGIYVVTKQVASFIVFGLFAVETSIAPSIAALYATGQIIKLQIIVSKSTAVLAGMSFPIVILLATFGKHILLLFGNEFVNGAPTLIVLCVGQLINVIFGPIGQLGIHTGNEKITSIIVGAGAIINIILNILFIPKWGMIGAATATAISLAFWNIVLSVYLYKKIKIISGPFIFFKNIIKGKA